MNSYLVLSDSSSLPYMEGIDNCLIYKKCGFFMRAIRFLHHKTGLLKRLKSYWLNDWKTNVNNYSAILIFDSILDFTPLDYIRAKNGTIRIVFCFRNRVKERIHHSVCDRNPETLVNNYKCELWSYNLEDCDFFHMKKYNQFFLINPLTLKDKEEIQYDVYFIGSDKGRIGTIVDLKHIMDNQSITYKLAVVPDRGVRYSKEEESLLSKKKPYSDVLEELSYCKCVLDVVANINYGLTYRGLEALLYKKKLITNYTDIVKEPFYNKDNVFVLGVDRIEALSAFINSPFNNGSLGCLKEYSYSFFCEQIFGFSK